MRKTRIMPVSYRTFPIHWLVEQYITFLGTEHTKKLSLSSHGKNSQSFIEAKVL